MASEAFRIGVFDSGVGGLTVVREIRRLLPALEIVYFGDTARVPYGNKSPETIRRYSQEIANFLMGQGIQHLVVACNTSSSHALDLLSGALPVPVLGMIEPGAAMAVAESPKKHIGLIGTRATVASGAYERAVRQLDASATFHAVECPLFVPLVEEGWADDPVSREVARRYLEPLLDEGVDTIILGCTHYPVLIPALREVVGPEVRLVSSAEAAAKHLTTTLSGLLPPSGGEGELRIFVTDIGTHFQRIGEVILGYPIAHLEHVHEERLVTHEK